MKMGSSPEQIEVQRRRMMILVFARVGCVFLGVFGFLSLLDKRFMLGAILFLFMALGIIIAFNAKKTTYVQPLSLFLSTALFFLNMYLVISGGNQGTGIFWSFPLSMLMVLLVGPKLGLFYMILYGLCSATLLLGSFEIVFEYNDVERTRFLAATIALFALIICSERIRFRSYKAISETYKEKQSMAFTDSLTNVLNRHGLENAMKQSSARNKAILTLIDADDFKEVNDKFGHDFGDLVLTTLARILRENTKGADLIARWGGEEFLLILFNTTLPEAKVLVTKIKYVFHSNEFKYGDEVANFTFSAGMSQLNAFSEFEKALKEADEKLYEAKGAGKNIVVAS